MNFDVLVIGAGVSGLTAAEQAARQGLSVCVAEAAMFGGLAVNVNHLQPGVPGLPSSGSELCSELMSRISDLGVETLFEVVVSVEPDEGGTLRVVTGGGKHEARSVIVASGARRRKLGVPGEAELEHRGVAECADCDAPLYRGQVAVLVGGGDSALQEAIVLAEFCSAVHLVHRGTSLSGRADFADAVHRTPRIQVHLQTVVDEIVGAESVTAVKVRDLTSGVLSELPCKGVFVYIGLEPNISYLPQSVERDGIALRVNEQMGTSLPNVYAVGAARSGYGGQLTDSMRDATTAVKALSERLRRS
jgi:thioredoxin reductase (NADPH)